MVASFSLVSGQLLHLFELGGRDSEFDGFELNRYLLNDLFNNLRCLLLQACVVWIRFVGWDQKVAYKIKSNRYDLLDKLGRD